MRIIVALILGFLTLIGLQTDPGAFVAAGWVIWYLSGKFENLKDSIHQTQVGLAAQGTEIMTHNERLFKLQAVLDTYKGDVEQLLKDIKVAKKTERVAPQKQAQTEGDGSPEEG
jgi:hypothetical protein